MNEPERRSRALRFYFLITYAVFLLNTAAYFLEVTASGPIQPFFLAAVHLTYSFLYLIPFSLLVLGWSAFVSRPLGERCCAALFISQRTALAGVAIVLFGLVQVLFFADRFVFHIFGFHLSSGFVRNLILTRGGIESMGGDSKTDITFALIAAAFISVQALAWLAAWKLSASEGRVRWVAKPKTLVCGVVFLVVLGLFERVTYAVSSARQYAPVLLAANAFPLYMPLTFRSALRKLGIERPRSETFKMKVDTIHLKYPLEPLRRSPSHTKYNIVWLVSESLRADMLDAEIMPATWAFAQKSAWFQTHFSGGNGTRMGVFSMFYGLYGPYWFPFLEERRGPVLVDLLLEDNYDMQLYTSARFTYPEFDRTIWARIPPERLHEAGSGYGWERDRRNVDEILNFIDAQTPERPFMTFEFFESPHARYYFPPETVIRQPYLEELNYATMDLVKDMPLIKNRYINSCRHLDTQIERILKRLEERKLLDSTIVVITGDHGEEFMERGRWGHNSAFSEEQMRVPFVLWIPGRKPEVVTRMTSHLDIPATILKVLGVENPSADFTLGFDLFGPERREFTVLASWDELAYVDERFIGVFPLRSALGFTQQVDRTKTGDRTADSGAFLEHARPRLLGVMKELKRFSK